jgi:hypothetical protein
MLGKELKQKTVAYKRDAEKTKNRRWKIGIVVASLVSLIVGGFVGPIISSYVASSLIPHPKIEIQRDKTFIVPILGDNKVIIVTNVKNTGLAPEQGIIVRWEVKSPLTFINITNGVPVALGPIVETPLGNLPSGQTFSGTIGTESERDANAARKF